MAKQWQIRRGTTAENNEFTGAIGEITMDTEKKQLRIHDGETLGGIEIPTVAPIGKRQPNMTALWEGNTSGGDITLSESYLNYDAIMIWGGGDDNYVITNIIPTYQLKFMFEQTTKASFDIFGSWLYWILYNYANNSTETFWRCHTQNSRLYAVYGINYLTDK